VASRLEFEVQPGPPAALVCSASAPLELSNAGEAGVTLTLTAEDAHGNAVGFSALQVRSGTGVRRRERVRVRVTKRAASQALAQQCEVTLQLPAPPAGADAALPPALTLPSYSVQALDAGARQPPRLLATLAPAAGSGRGWQGAEGLRARVVARGEAAELACETEVAWRDDVGRTEAQRVAAEASNKRKRDHQVGFPQDGTNSLPPLTAAVTWSEVSGF